MHQPDDLDIPIDVVLEDSAPVASLEVSYVPSVSSPLGEALAAVQSSTAEPVAFAPVPPDNRVQVLEGLLKQVRERRRARG